MPSSFFACHPYPFSVKESALLRFSDRYIGQLICCLLSPFKRKRKISACRRILFIEFFEMGAAIMSYSALKCVDANGVSLTPQCSRQRPFSQNTPGDRMVGNRHAIIGLLDRVRDTLCGDRTAEVLRCSHALLDQFPRHTRACTVVYRHEVTTGTSACKPLHTES